MSLVQSVCDIAEDAGRAILEIYADDSLWHVQKKSDASPLTAADLASHQLIAQALGALTPEIPVLSEESAEEDIAARREWHRCWVVDPLDGTKEFLKRNGEFCVNIALVEGDRVILGVVHAPEKGLTYFAEQGGGAFKRDAAGTVTQLQTRRLAAGDEVTMVASRHHRSPREDVLFENIRREFGPYHVMNFGSAFKICMVAEGAADCYPRFGATMEWDTAAAQIIIEEAGGHLISFRGMPFLYNVRETLTNRCFLAVGDQPQRWVSCWPPADPK